MSFKLRLIFRNHYIKEGEYDDSYDKTLVEAESVSSMKEQNIHNNYYTSVDKKNVITHHIIDQGEYDSGENFIYCICHGFGMFNIHGHALVRTTIPAYPS